MSQQGTSRSDPAENPRAQLLLGTNKWPAGLRLNTTQNKSTQTFEVQPQPSPGTESSDSGSLTLFTKCSTVHYYRE